MKSERSKWMPREAERDMLFFRSGCFHDEDEWLAQFETSSRNTGLRAQIAALEEEDAYMVAFLGGTYTDENREWRQAKIAALRKELEG